MKSIEPPPELSELHQAQVGLFTSLATLAYGKPADDPLNLFELVIPAFAALPALQAAEANLDPQVRQQLIDSGCLDSEGEEGAGGDSE